MTEREFDYDFGYTVKMLERHIGAKDWKKAGIFYHKALVLQPNNRYLQAYADRILKESGHHVDGLHLLC